MSDISFCRETFAKAGAGDRDAQNRIYAATMDIVRPYLIRRLSRRACSDAGEDVAQAVCASVFDHFRGSGGIGTAPVERWILAAAHDRAVDAMRAQAGRRRRDSSYARAVGEADRATGEPGGSETSGDLWAVVNELPEQQAAALRLLYKEGLGLHDAARRLGRPLGAFRQLVKRAIAGLRRMLRPPAVAGRMGA